MTMSTHPPAQLSQPPLHFKKEQEGEQEDHLINPVEWHLKTVQILQNIELSKPQFIPILQAQKSKLWLYEGRCANATAEGKFR